MADDDMGDGDREEKEEPLRTRPQTTGGTLSFLSFRCYAARFHGIASVPS